MTDPRNMFIAYETSHVDEACKRAASGASVVCIDAWVERELAKRNVPFVSMLDFIDSETDREMWWVLAQDVAREWYRLPALQFFEHKGIRIGEFAEPMMEVYASRLFFYARIYEAFRKKYPRERVSIPAPLPVGDTGGLIAFERWAAYDAARLIGLENTEQDTRLSPPAFVFAPDSPKAFLVRAYNALMSLMPRRPLKIYACEYWSHIGSTIERMPDAELVLTEVNELKHIPWRQIIKHRIRVRHPHTAVTSAMKRHALAQGGTYRKQWEAARAEVATYLGGLREEFDWNPVLDACEHIVRNSPRVVADIDALERILREEKPDVVVQLASVGGRQHHFLLMARIAEQLHIPSIELQHAGAYIDPRSAYSRIETTYLASYGPYTNTWYERIGYEPERLVSIGSPRFDRCRIERFGAVEKGKQLFVQLGLDTTRQVLFVAVPFSNANLFALDSYQLIEFFKTMRSVQEQVPGLQILFKFRNYAHVGATREYLQEVFTTDSAIAGSEDISALLSASDAAVCGNSTVLYQTMLAEKPLVLYPWKAFDTYHAQVYEPAAPIARSTDEIVALITRLFADAAYRAEFLAREKSFLNGYSFDGRSSERLAKLFQGKLYLRL